MCLRHSLLSYVRDLSSVHKLSPLHVQEHHYLQVSNHYIQVSNYLYRYVISIYKSYVYLHGMNIYCKKQ